MDMDVMEEFTGSTTMVVRGKRSKRARQSSPFSTISTSSDGGGGDNGEGMEINSSVPSLSMCSEISTSTEEDEDMANCLILLAQSGCHQRREIIQEGIKIEKIVTTKKFSEMATTTIGYECKTCNRSFPSFQALGGHRASHKKPKQMVVDEKKPIQITTSSSSSLDHQEQKHHQNHQKHHQKQQENQEEQLSIAKKSSHGVVNKSKIHECSICGLEFTSGQALGGHMRRHRTSTTSKVSNMSNGDSSHERPRNILQLDLNLPAPEDHDHHDSKFQFSANQQHIFSSMALVDCHY